MPRLLTLTTDFGPGSLYVAQLKARLLHAQAGCSLVDIAHDLPAHDVRGASWFIGQACLAFPADTLHLVVIDPGVGTERKLVWARIGTQAFLAPDNGLLTHAMKVAPLQEARLLPVPTDASATFHGRDVIAAAACRLLDGEPATALGGELTRLEELPEAAPSEGEDGIQGEVRFIDHFGNLLTNIPAEHWPAVVEAGGVVLGDRLIDRPVRTYGDAPPGTAVTLVGSQGVLEIAVVEGSAARLLGGEIGTPVRISRR